MTDIPYGPHCLQRLDLYLPACRPFPVLVFVHGGSWISEDKAIFVVVGRYLAANGVGAVVVNYRLPPEVNCQGELQDVARAVAWTGRNIAGYGGDPGGLFLCGHSAGAHLACVLATNPAYLAAEGVPADAVRGVVCFSGFYRVGIEFKLFGVSYVFQGMDRAAVSPFHQVRAGLPPFMLLYAERELPYLPRQARRFRRKLLACGAACHLYVVPGEDHYGQVLNIAAPNATQGPRILRFIRQQVPGPTARTPG
jgi:acetyl esterase/lipase